MGLMTKLFGTYSDRELKAIYPIVDKVEAGSCKVVSDVEITSNPVFPQTKKYVLTAALGGIVAACGILVLDHLLHDYIVDSEDIQKKLELPVLGLIPEV